MSLTAGELFRPSLGNVPNAIWWAHPWASVAKYAVDGAIYAVLTGLVFAWLWPAA